MSNKIISESKAIQPLRCQLIIFVERVCFVDFLLQLLIKTTFIATTILQRVADTMNTLLKSR